MLDEKFTKFEPWYAFDIVKEVSESTDTLQVLMYSIYDVWYIYIIYFYPIHINMSDVVA